jgi:hypothetical protein
VVADFRFHARVTRHKCAEITRTKRWKLKGEAQQTFRKRMITVIPWDEEGGADSMWLNMATSIQKVASDIGIPNRPAEDGTQGLLKAHDPKFMKP